MRDLLGPDVLADALVARPDWSGDTGAIRRTAELPGFRAAIAVVDAVAEAAEELDHHPDIDIRWRRLAFTLSTHSVGGVTDLDLALADRIDAAITANADA